MESEEFSASLHLHSYALISMFDFVLQQRLPFCWQLCCQLRKGLSNKKASSRFSSGLRLCLFAHWCQGTESNRRHQHFQCCALPTELPWHVISMRHTITSPYSSVNTFLVAFFSYVSRCVKLVHCLHKLKFPSVPI